MSRWISSECGSPWGLGRWFRWWPNNAAPLGRVEGGGLAIAPCSWPGGQEGWCPWPSCSMWYTTHIAQLLLIVASFNKRISLSAEAFKVILHGLNQASTRVYATLCSDIGTCSELRHAV